MYGQMISRPMLRVSIPLAFISHIQPSAFITPCVEKHEYALCHVVYAEPVAGDAYGSIEPYGQCRGKPFVEECGRCHGIAVSEKIAPLQIHRYGMEHLSYAVCQFVRFNIHNGSCFGHNFIDKFCTFCCMCQYPGCAVTIELVGKLLRRETVPQCNVRMPIAFLEPT